MVQSEPLGKAELASQLFSFGSLENDVMTLVDELSGQIEVSSYHLENL